jgi:hypothetical protein
LFKKSQPKKTSSKKEKLMAPVLPNVSGIAKITTQEEMSRATSILSDLNKQLDAIITYKEKKTKPLNEALKIIRAETKPYEEELNALIADIRLKMTTYQTNLIQQQKEEEQRAIDLLASGAPLEKALDIITPVTNSVSTDSGTISFRPTPKLKINDLSMIDDMYFDLNEARLLADLKAGKIVPGAVIEIIQVPVNRLK